MHLVESVTRTTQNTPEAVAWAAAGAAVLERLLMGQGAAAAVEATIQELQGGGSEWRLVGTPDACCCGMPGGRRYA
jgi:ADP-ribosylglycohydrolase